MKKFKQLIPTIKAGGGIVYNQEGKVLMIKRHGKWDLPKGKKEKDENIGFLRVQTNEGLTEAWLGTAAIFPQYQGKGYGSEGLRLLEKEFSTIKQWDLCTVLQDAGMVAFYEKNGYRQTPIEPGKEGLEIVYMKN